MWSLLLSLAQAADLPPLDALEARGLAAVEPVLTPAPAAVLLFGGTVMTATGATHSPGWVHLDGGRIAEVGAGAPPELPGVARVDLGGRFVTPGLIDTHSHLGVYPSPGARAHSDGNEATAPTTPGVWAEHSFWPQDPGIERAVAGGVTTFQILPGSANLIGGRGVVLHALPARGSRAMRLEGAPETVKMACGENPKRVYESSGPSTRMGNLRGQREAFLAAAEALRKWETYAADLAEYDEKKAEYEAKKDAKRKKDRPEDPGDPPEPPARDLDTETLIGVLRGEILPQIHCYRADDMLSMLQLADELGFQVRSFHHALEAYKIRDVLAERGVAVSTWADWWGFKLEAWDGIPENAALVHAAGGRAIIHSDSAIGIQRLNQEAAKALSAGRAAGLQLTEDDALRWITANPAWALGVEDQVGALAPGHRADVVVWSGHPFSVYSAPERVYIDGVLRLDGAAAGWSDFTAGVER